MKNTNETIEQILEANSIHLGKDLDKYRNHVYRVFNFCLKMDGQPSNREKYAIATAFHDIGIWTNKNFDYLHPSILLAKKYLTANGKEAWIEEISLMIDMHHKLSKYKGVFEETAETLRKADWMDLTKGIMTFSISKKDFSQITLAYPNLGFHFFLIKQSVRHFFKSPLNPLPMFKK